MPTIKVASELKHIIIYNSAQFEKSSSSFGKSDRPRQKKGIGIGKQDEYFCLTLSKFMGDLGDMFEGLGDLLPLDAANLMPGLVAKWLGRN